MLQLKNITKTFNKGTITEKHALNGVNLTLEDGNFVTVIGGNGAGKSTGLPDFKRASLIGRVFQDPMTGTAATMQIDENLALAARRGKKRGLKWEVTAKER